MCRGGPLYTRASFAFRLSAPDRLIAPPLAETHWAVVAFYGHTRVRQFKGYLPSRQDDRRILDEDDGEAP